MLSAGILLVCFAIALLATSALRGMLIWPLENLAETARVVSRKKDYSVRAQIPQRRDELAFLVQSFNEMLDEIETSRAVLEQKVAERTAELSAANRELEAFSYTVAHDLRGPLQQVANIGFLLKAGMAEDRSPDSTALLEKLVSATNRMSSLIDDLLNLSRAASTPIQHVPVDMSALARSILGAWLRGQAPSDPNQQNPLKTMSLEQLGNIEVTTVSKEPEVVWKTPAAIYVITQENIRRSGAQNIPEALRLAPGVEVARITSGEYAIGIRGFNSRLSRSVLVLMDGRTVYSTFTAGTYWETQDTVMNDIDRIEVIRGPGGTIWGPNAVNGVINIITKNTKDTQGTLRVSGGGGNVYQVFGDARYGSGNSKGFTYRVYAKGFGWAPQYHPDGDNYDDWHSGQGGFRVDWNPNARDAYRLHGDGYRHNFGEQVSAVTYDPPATRAIHGDASLYGGNILWSWRRVLGEREDMQLAAYYDHATRNELNFGDIRNTVNVDFLERFGWKRHDISWGFTLRFSHGNEAEVFSGLTFVPSHRTDQLYQGFVQDAISLAKDRLSLVVGTKVLKTNYTGALAEPSIKLMYNPTSTQTLWAAFTHALRTPADG